MDKDEIDAFEGHPSEFEVEPEASIPDVAAPPAGFHAFDADEVRGDADAFCPVGCALVERLLEDFSQVLIQTELDLCLGGGDFPSMEAQNARIGFGPIASGAGDNLHCPYLTETMNGNAMPREPGRDGGCLTHPCLLPVDPVLAVAQQGVDVPQWNVVRRTDGDFPIRGVDAQVDEMRLMGFRVSVKAIPVAGAVS